MASPARLGALRAVLNWWRARERQKAFATTQRQQGSGHAEQGGVSPNRRMKPCVHCATPAVEQYTFVLDSERVLGEAWVCRACLDRLLAADRITLGEEFTHGNEATNPL